MSSRKQSSLAAVLVLILSVCGSITASQPAAAKPPPSKASSPASQVTEIVVKVDLPGGHTIAEVTAAFPVQIESALLASRGIYLVRVTDPKDRNDLKKIKKLVDQIGKSRAVVYAEANSMVSVADSRYHAWRDGEPRDTGADPAIWSDQPAVTNLQLSAVHARSRGLGAVVAVLDTGADQTQPALAGRLLPGWNYVDDNADTADVAQGVDDDDNGVTDQAHGHGTFVAGLVALIAPDAQIMPGRVLDSDGYGNIFVIAQAILDASDAGANVINLSLGTSEKLGSRLLEDSITAVQKKGVVVVAAAGNEASNSQEYPASQKNVLSVTAVSTGTDQLAPFSNWGKWVSVAAPGDPVGGPLPGGEYAWWAGTSMATAFVAGQLAVIETAAPTLDVKTQADAVTRTVTPLGSKSHLGSINIMASLDYAASHSKKVKPKRDDRRP